MIRIPKTLVCFAVVQESKPFLRRLSPGPELEVLVTGMGPHNARKSFERQLTTCKPDRVFTCGFAGGLNPDCQGSQVFFETSSPELSRLLEQAGAKAARFLCTSRVAATADEKRALRARGGEDLVEMESGVIQSVCQARGLPCATVRVVSDAANEDLALDFNQLMTPDYRLSGLKLAGALLRRPGRIPALLRLGKTTASAAESLADLLERTLRVPATV
ncbi:MAG: hypothetical protein JNN07_10620 [Verrucomicrobiales bacterium]|nr:hypothetical protein [Verrucomicrobiales bacterium]